MIFLNSLPSFGQWFTCGWKNQRHLNPSLSIHKEKSMFESQPEKGNFSSSSHAVLWSANPPLSTHRPKTKILKQTWQSLSQSWIIWFKYYYSSAQTWTSIWSKKLLNHTSNPGFLLSTLSCKSWICFCGFILFQKKSRQIKCFFSRSKNINRQMIKVRLNCSGHMLRLSPAAAAVLPLTLRESQRLFSLYLNCTHRPRKFLQHASLAVPS